MPLIQIRYRTGKVGYKRVDNLIDAISSVAAKGLACEEGGPLAAEDMMVEVDLVGPQDRRVKDVNIRIIAHDYPTRRENLVATRRDVQRKVAGFLTSEMSYYVWPMLGYTSYGSDTEPDMGE